MSKRHDAVFDDVLRGMGMGMGASEGEGEAAAPRDRSAARFLKRSTTMAEHAEGSRQERLQRLVDPAACVMWAGHNRAYERLTPESCRDLIDGIRAQGRQEFPAIVRRLRPAHEGTGPEFEVICGARRHFAVSWLRANTYPQIRYLIEERDLTDEEAFRLADIENRDHADLSDLERARDYARAVEQYYGGEQKRMAERLQVSASWLSRYLQLARLEEEVIAAFADPGQIREIHARRLRPLLARPETRALVLEEAARLARRQQEARQAGKGALAPAQVLARLRSAAQAALRPAAAREVGEGAGAAQTPLSRAQKGPEEALYRRDPAESGVRMRRRGGKVTLEFEAGLPDAALRAAIEKFIEARAEG